MKTAKPARKKAYSLPVLFFAVLAAFPAFAADPPHVVPSVPPGIYSSTQIISFSRPEGSRLLVTLDGKEPAEPSAPILLSVPEGVSRDFRLETVLYPLDPSGASAHRESFSWTIDRLCPAVPVFSAKKCEGGRQITVVLSEPGTVHWNMYHPWYGASASGSVLPGEPIFVPDGASLCAYGVDLAGNRGSAGTPESGVSAGAPGAQLFPCRLTSPVPGTWANPQTLVVEHGAGVSVRYTTDGSDPAVSGIAYTDPVLLSDTSINLIRLLAVDAFGERYTSQVRFTIRPSRSVSEGTSPVAGLPSDGSLVETGEFMEIHLNDGFTASPGNVVLPDSASSQLVLTSVRGVRTFTPVTVTDGKDSWRWMCAGGKSSFSGTDSASDAASGPASVPAPASAPAFASESVSVPAPAAGSPKIAVHDWYFVEIGYRDPVYVSLDSGSWQPVLEPVFVDRSADHVLRWYSGSWKNGEVQKISLPAKPVLSGLPVQSLTSNPVFITAPGTSCVLRYSGGTFMSDAPNASSPELASGLLVEVPKGTESLFSFRFLAFAEGLAQGEIHATFTIDRKNPRTPDPGIPESLVYSRDPVVLRPSGEDMLQAAVEPALFSMAGNSFILEGDPDCPVDYTITLFAVDRAGNLSPVLTRNLTVDINALYVDASASVEGKRDGSPSAPYVSLDDAFDAIRGKGSWRVYVAGDTVLSSPHVLANDIDLIGTGGTISAGQGSAITVSGVSLAIKDCPILRTKDGEEKSGLLARSDAPFIRLDNARFQLEGCTLRAADGTSGTLIHAANSSITMENSNISFSASEYALVLDAEKSEVLVKGSALAVSARDSAAVSLTSSSARFEQSTVSVSAVSACRAVEAWDSRLSMDSLSLVRNAGTSTAGMSTAENRDTALWLDAKSSIVSEISVSSPGFWRYRGTEKSR